MQKVRKWWGWVSSRKYFPFIIVILVIGVYIAVTTSRHTLQESPEYLNCIKEAHEQYAQLWHDNSQLTTIQIQQADDLYDAQTGQCAESYSIGWKKIKAIQDSQDSY